jgi:stress response protein YsnF
MPRTIAALYDSRREAEFARARLVSDTKARSPRIISKDTLGAVDGLKIGRADAEVYRDGIRSGAHLLVAEVPSGVSARRVIDALEASLREGMDDGETGSWGDGDQGVQVKLPEDATAKESTPPAAEATRERSDWPPKPPSEPTRPAQRAEDTSPEFVDQDRLPVVEERLRIGKRQMVRGGARVRSHTREEPAEELVSLDEEIIEVGSRPCERELSQQEVEDGGLFSDRVFEIAQMREEPVVTKVAVVREEVIVRKTVKKRTETIRDTVRRTDVEVEDLPASDGG